MTIFAQSRLSRAPVVAALALLVGCTVAPSAPPAGTQFDGTYSGENTLVSGFGGYICGQLSFPFSITVQNGRFVYAYYPTPLGPPAVPVQVRADGSLDGKTVYLAENYLWRGPDLTTAWLTVDGHISGPVLDATVRDYRCVRHLVLQRP